MDTDILIRTFYKDVYWLEHCLRSIYRHCRGYINIVVVFPENQYGFFEHIKNYPRVILKTCKKHDDDYIKQQLTKLHSDEYTDSHYIWHVDSDNIYTKKFNPRNFMSGRIICDYNIYSKTRQYFQEQDPSSNPWLSTINNFFDLDNKYDFMRRFPIVYPRWIYPELRKFCLETHKISIEDYYQKEKDNPPSEFNLLGAYAWYYRREMFEWREIKRDLVAIRLDTGKKEFLKHYRPLMQLWSHFTRLHDFQNESIKTQLDKFLDEMINKEMSDEEIRDSCLSREHKSGIWEFLFHPKWEMLQKYGYPSDV